MPICNPETGGMITSDVRALTGRGKRTKAKS